MLKGLRVETNIIAQRGFMPELQKRVWLFLCLRRPPRWAFYYLLLLMISRIVDSRGCLGLK